MREEGMRSLGVQKGDFPPVCSRRIILVGRTMPRTTHEHSLHIETVVRANGTVSHELLSTSFIDLIAHHDNILIWYTKYI